MWVSPRLVTMDVTSPNSPTTVHSSLTAFTSGSVVGGRRDVDELTSGYSCISTESLI
jgi:hypothetical protein